MKRWWKIIFFVSIVGGLVACKPPEVEVTAVPPTRTAIPTQTITATLNAPAPLSRPTAIPAITPSPTLPPPTETAMAVPTATPSLWKSIGGEQLNEGTEVMFEVVNQIGGEMTAVDVKDNVAFLGIGPRLVTVDISDPSRLQVIGQSDILPGVVQDFVLVGDMAFVATGENGFWIIDIANPYSPQVVAFKPQSAKVQQIAYQDKYLYVMGAQEDGELESKLVIYSIADPENAREINQLTLPFRYFYGDMILEDESIYLASNYSPNLYVVNMAQPEQPLLLNTITVAKNAAKTVSNKTLYVLENEELQIFNVSDSEHAFEIAQVENLIDAHWEIDKIMVRGNLLFVSVWYCDQSPCGGTLFVFDISQPGRVQELISIPLDSGLIAIQLTNDKMFAITSSMLLITQFPEWDQSSHFLNHTTYNAFDRLTVADGRLYVVSGSGHGIGIFSLEQPTQPDKVGAYSGAFDEIAAGNNQMYPSAGWREGLHQVDVQRPALPRRTSILGEDWDSVDGPPVLENGRLYALLNGYLAILDVSKPGEMALLNDLAPDPQEYGPYSHISVADNFVYTLSLEGIHLLDTSDPNAVAEIGFIPEGDDNMCDLTAMEGYVFVYSAAPYCSQFEAEVNRLTIYDASNPTTIHKLGSLELASPVETMLLKDDYLYLANGDLTVVDVSLPDSPQIVGFFPTPGQAHAVAAFEDLIYVADGAGGLLVLRPLP